jgi:urease accessory protein
LPLSFKKEDSSVAKEDRVQRSVGSVGIVVRTGRQGTVLQGLAQSGCLRACFPRMRGGALEAVILNSAGGTTDGDRLRIDATAGPGTRLVLSTPSAERIYRARPEAKPATHDILLTLEDGARLDFLPQETILFDACALDRTLTIDMHGQADFLGVEALVFGRQDSGETLSHLRLRDTIRLRRDGRLLLQDAVRLDGDVDRLLQAAASAGGRRAVATLIHAAPDACAGLAALRGALCKAPAETGASAWDGLLVTRILAADAQALRRSVLIALAVLRPGQALPRVWNS